MNVSDYMGLVTSFHRPKVKYNATLEGVVSKLVETGNVVGDLPEDFDLDSAVGVQLDVVGEWVGITRTITIPLPTPWFSFDTANRGLDEGVWKGPLSATKGISSLDDNDYRDIIRAKILSNHWDGTVSEVKNILDAFFLPRGIDILIHDRQDMSMMLVVPGERPNLLLLSIMDGAYIPVKPVGVKVNYILPSVSNQPLFGFDMDNSTVAGLDTGTWGVTPGYILEST